jgi:DNA-binding beta-propeller fold protein YncE
LKKFRVCIPLLFFLFFFMELHPRSAEFVRSISLMEKESTNLLTALLGRKKEVKYHPSSLFFIDQELVGVTDQRKGILLIVNRTGGKIIRKIKRFSKESFISPVSGCCDQEGFIYIADSALRAIIRFNNKHKFDKVFHKDKAIRITGISCFKGKLFCTDTRNHRVIVFNRDGEKLYTIGKRGNKILEFNFPTHLTVNSKHLIVNDAMNFRIQVLNHQGDFVRSFGKPGRGGGNFSKPKGVAIDQQGRIYVADSMFDNVQVFNEKGELLSFFGGPGKEHGKFWMPQDVIVDDMGFIWVTDTYNCRIEIYRIRED